MPCKFITAPAEEADCWSYADQGVVFRDEGDDIETVRVRMVRTYTLLGGTAEHISRIFHWQEIPNVESAEVCAAMCGSRR